MLLVSLFVVELAFCLCGCFLFCLLCLVCWGCLLVAIALVWYLFLVGCLDLLVVCVIWSVTLVCLFRFWLILNDFLLCCFWFVCLYLITCISVVLFLWFACCLRFDVWVLRFLICVNNVDLHFCVLGLLIGLVLVNMWLMVCGVGAYLFVIF